MDPNSSDFTEAELAYLHDGRRLGRIATVGSDGTPHWPAPTRGVRARSRCAGARRRSPDPRALVRIHPERIVSWGLGPVRSARDVGPAGSPARAA